MTPSPRTRAPAARSRWRLGFAATAVMLAAADTYVVVLALPAIMGDIGISFDHLEQATPVISGFLLGYIAFLPLLGRLSDRVGRESVFVACLLGFAMGSLITASAHDLAGTVVGRTVQGLGGGGLVPVTLAIVADLWPEGRRGVPLGVVGGVQELGSVLGPLYGAAIISVTTWRVIFWLNVPLALLLGIGFHGSRAQTTPTRATRDIVGVVLGLTALLVAGLALAAPAALTDSVVWGLAYAPVAGGLAVTEPISLVAMITVVAFVMWEWRTDSAFLPLRKARRLWKEVDGAGALLLAVVLGAVVIAFASADPSSQLISPGVLLLLPVAATVAGVFVIHESRRDEPLVPVAELRGMPAWGALLTNLALGAGLIAALIDVPIFARATVYPGSQVAAALVLLRFLVAVPVGAVVGGALCERLGYRTTAAVGMALSTVSFAVMATWGSDAIGGGLHPSDGVLATCGLGFGLAIAPVNGAILGAVRASLHGLAAALAVVARMIGMLVGVSLLTVVGLHSFYAAAATLPSPTQLCPNSPLHCPAYDVLATAALLSELHTIFIGAAVCTACAAVIALVTLRRVGDLSSTSRPVTG